MTTAKKKESYLVELTRSDIWDLHNLLDKGFPTGKRSRDRLAKIYHKLTQAITPPTNPTKLTRRGKNP